MNPYTYTREGNNISAHEDGKPSFVVATIDEDGKLRMAHGMAGAHKEAVQQFLADSGDEDEEGGGTPEGGGSAHPLPAGKVTPPSPLDLPQQRIPGARGGPPAVPPCPPEDPEHGDKTPAVIEWYRAHDPAGFKKRYGHRKGHFIHDPHRRLKEEEENQGGGFITHGTLE